MEKILKSLTFCTIVASLAFLGCNENTQEEVSTTTDTLMSNAESGFSSVRERVWRNTGDDDRDFLGDAIELNTEEIRALKLGQQKGGAEVQKHAAQMLSDHEALGKQVNNYLSTKNVTLNDIDTSDIDDDLHDEQAGLEFDREWAEQMVEDHEDAVELFEDAQDDVKDQELKTIITNTLPKLRSHLDMSRQLRDRLANTDANATTTNTR